MIHPNGDSLRLQILLAGPDLDFPIVEDGCRQSGAGPTFLQGLGQMLDGSRTARGNHGNGYGICHHTRQLDIVAIFLSVTIHAREQDLASAVPHQALRPFDSIEPRFAPPSMRESSRAESRQVHETGLLRYRTAFGGTG